MTIEAGNGISAIEYERHKLQMRVVQLPSLIAKGKQSIQFSPVISSVTDGKRETCFTEGLALNSAGSCFQSS
jgi:hypothetical protein